MDPDQAVRLEQLQAGLEQELLHERVPDLHRRALALALLVELRARHGGAVDAVAAGARADVDHGVPCSARRAAEDAIRLEQPERERVHQAVAVERCVEGDLARDRGNADAVAVPGDPGHHSLEQPRGPRMRRIAESQRVHRGDRPRAHGEHVAQDAAHSRCGALIRLDVARMVVALHLEGDGQAATDVDHTGVLAGTLQYPRTLCREVPEQAPARLVRAMLAPHGGKDAQLHDVRVAPEHLADARILVLREAVRRYDLGGAGRHGSRNIPDRKPGGVTTDLRKGCKKPPVALRSGSMTRVEGEDQSRLAEAERRQRILSEVSRVLLDYVGPDEIEPLRRIVHQVTDALANDWCAFALVQPDGTLKNVATYHPDPRQRELAKKLDVLVPPRRWDVGPAELNPFLERRPIVTEEITDEMLRAAIPSEEAFQALKEIGLTSAIVVPMFDGSEPLGRLLLASTGKGRRYSNEDVDFAYSLAGRAALGVRNARLVRELARQRDIQSHERAEADRRFAELRAVFDSDPNGIALFDADGVLRMASHRIEEIFGLPLRAMYGQRFDEIYHQKLAQVAAQDREAMLERVRGIFANQETRAHDELELERPRHRWLTRRRVTVPGADAQPRRLSSPRWGPSRRRRGPRAARAGAGKPDIERHQVHAAGRTDHGFRGARRGRRARIRAGSGHRNSHRGTTPPLPALLPRRKRHHAPLQRARHRPVRRARDRASPRRLLRGPQRIGQGIHLHVLSSPLPELAFRGRFAGESAARRRRSGDPGGHRPGLARMGLCGRRG